MVILEAISLRRRKHWSFEAHLLLSRNSSYLKITPELVEDIARIMFYIIHQLRSTKIIKGLTVSWILSRTKFYEKTLFSCAGKMQLKNNKTKRLSPNNKQLVHCPGIIHVRTVFMFQNPKIRNNIHKTTND